MQWSDGDAELLGITISNAKTQSNEALEKSTQKMENVASVWVGRNLPLTSKILLINSLMGSIFVYPMTVLPGNYSKIPMERQTSQNTT